jgi:lipoprotein-anchoring transpeptidase ErfK/SrfK
LSSEERGLASLLADRAMMRVVMATIAGNRSNFRLRIGDFLKECGVSYLTRIKKMRNSAKFGRQSASEGFDLVNKMVLMAAALATMLFSSSVEGRAASLVANIDISSQTMTVRYGPEVYLWSVSTARKGYFTPRGSYRPQRTARMWYSRKYHMSPMPYSVFFRGGYAIHGTGAVKYLGRPASHGCVRLHTANAAAFYSMVKQAGFGNTRIVVTN